MRHDFPANYLLTIKPQHEWLAKKWSADHGIAFPPPAGTWYDDQTREVVLPNEDRVRVKTPPPWIGKVRYGGG